MNHFISLLTLVMFLYVPVSSFVNPLYGTCPPKKCGSVNITYPFYILNQHCGYPGFEVSCKDEKTPLINISGDSYIIQHIWNNNQSFQVINSLILNALNQHDCSSSIHNITLDNSILKFVNPKKEIILLLNCTDEILRKNEKSLVSQKCGALGVYENDTRLNDLGNTCEKSVVLIPYEEEGVRNESIRDVLRRGVLLNWTANNCTACTDSGGQCGFNSTTHEFNCFCSDRDHKYHCVPPNRKRNMQAIILSVVGSTVGILISIALFFYLKGRKSTKELGILWSRGRTKNQNVEMFLKTYTSIAPKRYSYTNIRKMTNSFKDKLGEGGYGSVYKGKLHDGRLVAVKVLKQSKGDGEEFINEVASIGRTNHVNIVTFVGFCFEGKKRALIYDLLSNGSLDKYMYGAPSGQSLPVEIQFNIVVGIAKGLDYLHRGCNTRILHFDIKPHNILLDEEFCPKISDFGLARLCLPKDSSISMLEARGTIGYIAPEVFCRNFGGVSHKSDVYSYGMMVLDMVCGRKNKFAEAQSSSELYFPEWIYNQLEANEEVSVDEILNEEEKGLERKMILVSLWCIQMYPSKRPSMSRVVEMLEGCVESLEMPPKPVESSSPRLVFDSSIETELMTTPLTM